MRLFFHEFRSALRDHRKLIFGLLILPLLPAADFLRLVYFPPTGEDVPGLGTCFTGGYTKEIPCLFPGSDRPMLWPKLIVLGLAVVTLAAFLVMRRVNPVDSQAYRRALPVPAWRLVAPRLLLLALVCVAYPAAIAAGTLALTYPSTGAMIAPLFAGFGWAALWIGVRLAFSGNAWRYGFRVMATLGATWFAVRLLGDLGVRVAPGLGDGDSFGNLILLSGFLGVVLPVWVAWSLWRRSDGRFPAQAPLWIALTYAWLFFPTTAVLPDVESLDETKLPVRTTFTAMDIRKTDAVTLQFGLPGLPEGCDESDAVSLEWALPDDPGPVVWRKVETGDAVTTPVVFRDASRDHDTATLRLIAGDRKDAAVVRFEPGAAGGIRAVVTPLSADEPGAMPVSIRFPVLANDASGLPAWELVRGKTLRLRGVVRTTVTRKSVVARMPLTAPETYAKAGSEALLLLSKDLGDRQARGFGRRYTQIYGWEFAAVAQSPLFYLSWNQTGAWSDPLTLLSRIAIMDTRGRIYTGARLPLVASSPQTWQLSPISPIAMVSSLSTFRSPEGVTPAIKPEDCTVVILSRGTPEHIAIPFDLTVKLPAGDARAPVSSGH